MSVPLPKKQLFISTPCPKILLLVIYNIHCVPLINLQASPVWKQLVLVLSRIILRFLKQAREHDGTGASLQTPAWRCSWKSPTLCHHHVPITTCWLWDAPTPALSLQGTQAPHGAAGVKLFPPLGSLQGTRVTNWSSKQQVCAGQAPNRCQGKWTPLHSMCVDFSLRETNPGHPHGPLWPPQSIAAPDLLKKRALLPELLSAPKRSQGEPQPWGSPQKPPSHGPSPAVSQDTPRWLCQAHGAGADGCARWDRESQRGTCHSAGREQTAAQRQVCP